MTKPYIDTYQNQNDDIVLVYIPEVKVMESVEPEHIVIKKDHIQDVINSLTNAIAGE
ncbi:hypothetical protein phiV208_42 [Vibrio phage phiV208]|nr:hypothetical protein phiV208_42 [Vibrio phage phiV208]